MEFLGDDRTIQNSIGSGWELKLWERDMGQLGKFLTGKLHQHPALRPMTQPSDKQPENRPKSVLRCFGGSLISSTIATGAYTLTRSISGTFAAKPIHSDNLTAIKISIAVRTLVVGMCALATFVFALSAVGLLALGIQRLVQQFAKTENVKP